MYDLSLNLTFSDTHQTTNKVVCYITEWQNSCQSVSSGNSKGKFSNKLFTMDYHKLTPLSIKYLMYCIAHISINFDPDFAINY